MAINQQNYAAVPRLAIGQVSVANANRDGTGTLATIMTAGASGSRIDAIYLKAVGTTTAGMIRLFVHDGTNARLLTEVPVLAIVPGANAPSWEAQLNTNSLSQVLPILLQSGHSLRASTHNAETFNVMVQGGDF